MVERSSYHWRGIRAFYTPLRHRRANWTIAGAGFGIHWPDVDEDLSVEGLLRGAERQQHAFSGLIGHEDEGTGEGPSLIRAAGRRGPSPARREECTGR